MSQEKPQFRHSPPASISQSFPPPSLLMDVQMVQAGIRILGFRVRVAVRVRVRGWGLGLGLGILFGYGVGWC